MDNQLGSTLQMHIGRPRIERNGNVFASLRILILGMGMSVRCGQRLMHAMENICVRSGLTPF